jgi:hypothetical protein
LANFITNNKIDKTRWDNLVSSSPNGLPYACSWYLDAVCNNWGIFSDNEMQTAIPVCYKKNAGIKIIYQPKFTRQFGFYGKPNQQLITDYFHFITGNFHEVILGLDNELSDSCNIKHKKYIFQYLSLNNNYESLHKNYSTNAVRQIKKAAKHNFSIDNDIPVADFVNFFKKNKGSEIKDLISKDYLTLLKIIENAQKNNAAKIISVLNQNEIYASACFLFLSDKILYLKGASTAKGRQSGAMYYLFDYLIKTHCHKYQLLDFNGSRIKGIADFNHKWGAINGEYLFIEQYNSPASYKLLKKIKKIFIPNFLI